MDPTEDAAASDRRETDVSLRRQAGFAPETFNDDARTVEVVWSTGARVERADFWTGERWLEELSMDSGAVDLSRLNAGAPLLNAHSSYDLSDQIGVVERAWLDGKNGRALVRFSPRPDVAPIVADVKAGIIRNLSVGYRVQKWVTTDPVNGGPKLKRAEAWTPYEVSFVPIPADAGAQVRSVSPPRQPPKETMMEPTTETTATTTTDTTERAAVAPAAGAPVVDLHTTAATTRAATLDEIDGIRQGTGLAVDWTLGQLRRDPPATIDQVRAAAIDELARQNRVPAGRHTSHITITRDERETLRQRMSDAVFARVANIEPTEAAREFAGIGLHGIMRELAERNGVRHSGRMSPADLFDSVRANELTSSDFSYILLNSSNKHLRASFGGFANTWAGWTEEFEVPDFKTITSAAFSNFPEPGVIAETQEIPRSALSDSGEQYAVQERAIIIGLSRKAIVNDDMRAIDRAVRSASLGAYTALRRAVWGLLTANYTSTTLGQTMADTNALVIAAHSNIGTTGALSTTTYNELRRLLTAQTMLAAKAGDAATPVVPPSEVLLLVGPKHENLAFQLTSPLIVPTATGGALPSQYKSTTTVVQDAFLGTAITAAATEPFFLVRGDIPPVEIAYLTGRRTPQAMQDEPFNFTGIDFRVDFPFRAYAVEWRSVAGNVGA